MWDVCEDSSRTTELLQRTAIELIMRPRIRDLTALLDTDGDLIARAGAAVLAHDSLPHPVLHLMEELYPNAVAKARFTALWSERNASVPDPRAIGSHFRLALTRALKLEKHPTERP